MQYICRKTGDEGSIYAARQGMKACNNNNMRNPSLHLYYGVTRYYCCILLVIPSSPVLLHIYFPHPVLLHINILPSSPVLLHIAISVLVSLLFGTVIPTSFNILMEIFLLPLIYSCMEVDVLLGLVQ